MCCANGASSGRTRSKTNQVHLEKKTHCPVGLEILRYFLYPLTRAAGASRGGQPRRIWRHRPLSISRLLASSRVAGERATIQLFAVVKVVRLVIKPWFHTACILFSEMHCYHRRGIAAQSRLKASLCLPSVLTSYLSLRII